MRTWALWIAVATAVVSGAVWAIARLWAIGDKTMKLAWSMLGIKALLTLLMSLVGGLSAAMVQAKDYPDGPAIVLVVLGAAGAAFIVIDQALKANTADSAALRGIDVVSINKLPGVTEIAGKPEPGQVERSAAHVAPATPLIVDRSMVDRKGP